MIMGCKVGTMSLDQSFPEFQGARLTEGFSEVLERYWPPFTVLETHEHEFDAKALVVQGEMWLTVQGETHRLQAGSTFELEARLPHAERYGASGATYWVARRSLPSAQC